MMPAEGNVPNEAQAQQLLAWQEKVQLETAIGRSTWKMGMDLLLVVFLLIRIPFFMLLDVVTFSPGALHAAAWILLAASAVACSVTTPSMGSWHFESTCCVHRRLLSISMMMPVTCPRSLGESGGTG